MNDHDKLCRAEPALTPKEEYDLWVLAEACDLKLVDGLLMIEHKFLDKVLAVAPEQLDSDLLLEIASRFEAIVQGRNDDKEVTDE